MGNRAVITCSKAADVASSNDIGVYLHWNGDPTSVNAFLAYCEARGFRSPDRDPYGWARLCQVIGNFFGGDLSVDIDACNRLDCDNYDNGVYVIEGWKVVDREYAPYATHGFDWCDRILEMLVAINAAQPRNDRLKKADLVEICRKRGWLDE